jgi:hypothetical protein
MLKTVEMVNKKPIVSVVFPLINSTVEKDYDITVVTNVGCCILPNKQKCP